ncbi:TlpA family protein disulfide reductase [Chryseobacterium sp. L7]|uniref:TlpA family protein disulfide reductase n=1 Tax=Chryseobacterium endalhagicum TaxID=2797638 RepID=A0ABS1QAM4_9FLAO|nr:TlpA disulfide reductase family protein [Chryseobacterium endalhagicum]MBL1219650.1 TlpA family protein disulfide reductase [Chryseobacterium endalhagicum]
MMRKILSLVLVLFLHFFYAQKVPNVSVINLNNEKVNVSEIDSSSPVVLTFWATWCLPCMEELNTINEKYEDWQKEARFTIYAVSTDDARTASKVKTVVKSKGWPYTILLDSNQTLKRALNVNSIPYLVLLHKGKIVYSHVGYSSGDEDELIAKIKDCYKN